MKRKRRRAPNSLRPARLEFGFDGVGQTDQDDRAIDILAHGKMRAPPATVTCGPWSPPMQSMANVTVIDASRKSQVEYPERRRCDCRQPGAN